MSLCWENCEFHNLVWLFGRSVVSGSLWPHGLQPARLLCPWDPPGKNTGVGCHALLQGHLPDSGTEPTHSALQADSLSVSCYGQCNPVHQNNKKVWKYIFWPFQHSFAVSPMKEHGFFVYFLCIQTVTKNLKCYYLEMYLKYLSCFAEDVTLIFFFFFSAGSENNLPFHSAIIFSVFWSAICIYIYIYIKLMLWFIWSSSLQR